MQGKRAQAPPPQFPVQEMLGSVLGNLFKGMGDDEQPEPRQGSARTSKSQVRRSREQARTPQQGFPFPVHAVVVEEHHVMKRRKRPQTEEGLETTQPHVSVQELHSDHDQEVEVNVHDVNETNEPENVAQDTQEPVDEPGATPVEEELSVESPAVDVPKRKRAGRRKKMMNVEEL